MPESIHIAGERGGHVVANSRLEKAANSHSTIRGVTSPVGWLTASISQNAQDVELSFEVGPDVPEGISSLAVQIQTDSSDEPLLSQQIIVDVPRTIHLAPQHLYISDGKVGLPTPIKILAANWKSTYPPIFSIDTEDLQIASAGSDSNNQVWVASVTPHTTGTSRKFIRVFEQRKSDGEQFSRILVTELPIVIKVLK